MKIKKISLDFTECFWYNIIMKKIGTCIDTELVQKFFGSVSEFARQIELQGNDFLYKNKIEVTYNAKIDVHTFWSNKNVLVY